MKKELWLPEKECTGCGACENACPKDVLKIELQPDGHLQPVASEGCIGCNQCITVCKGRIELPARGTRRPLAYAAWTKDSALRYSSTSGGLFSELARAILADGGIVYGAAYDADCCVFHESAASLEDLVALRQSKYVQSEVKLTFRTIKADLKAGRKVLFCGTPCQVAGLRSFLSKDYEGLYLMDFVCRGVNSPLAYRYWLKELGESCGSEVSRVWFKYKEGGWKSSPKRTRIDFKNGSHVVLAGADNSFMCGYLDSNLFLRPSCSTCQFKGFPRQGDVTVADFWGVDSTLDDDKGTSLVLVSSEKGRKLFDAVEPRVVSFLRDFDEILAGNICINASVSANSKMQEFMDMLPDIGFEAALAECSRRSFMARAASKIKGAVRKLVQRGE